MNYYNSSRMYIAIFQPLPGFKHAKHMPCIAMQYLPWLSVAQEDVRHRPKASPVLSGSGVCWKLCGYWRTLPSFPRSDIDGFGLWPTRRSTSCLFCFWFREGSDKPKTAQNFQRDILFWRLEPRKSCLADQPWAFGTILILSPPRCVLNTFEPYEAIHRG